MRASYCYVPVLPARGGAFRAIAALSPDARVRLTPVFNIPAAILKAGKTWEAYLAKRADGVRWCWEPARPFYIDVHDLDLELRTSTGRPPIEFVVSRLRDNGMFAIPVTGTEADRGREYLLTVKGLASRYNCGVGLRLAREEMEEPRVLEQAIKDTLEIVGIGPEDCDVFLDFGYVGKDSSAVLEVSAQETLAVLAGIGNFRNTALGGSSIPDQLGKSDQGIVRREKRIELDAWMSISTAARGGQNRIPLALLDYGIVGDHYVPPAKVMNLPSRIRYTTASDHVFRRANRSDYRELCKQLVSTSDYLGPLFSDGDRRIELSARGLAGPGAPALWAAYDTNHHLELVSEQAWSILRQLRLDRKFGLPQSLRRPWLQAELLRE
ncbi:MAG TPA: hypothetical protein VMI74_18640 [Burkholderiales bacterium]|nr:hypothetical protein [Burkholderiales bacterium]